MINGCGALGIVVEILQLQRMKQSLQKIASFFAITDWNESPARSPPRRTRATLKKNFLN
jgi:hypothetical protein